MEREKNIIRIKQIVERHSLKDVQVILDKWQDYFNKNQEYIFEYTLEIS